MSEQPEAYFVGKYWQMLIFKHFASFYHLLSQHNVLLVDVRQDLFKFFSEHCILIHHF